MKISIITLFPEMFAGSFDTSIIKRAQNKKVVEIFFVNLRSFGLGKHRTVDDTPYGGGHGMILKVDVLAKAIEKTRDPRLSKQEQKVVLLSAAGKKFGQKKAEDFSKLSHLILVCGHYEGVDGRIKAYIDEEVSIGDFVVTGGEIPAMLVADSVVRLLPGVLKSGVTDEESFHPFLEYPHYTKPAVYKNLAVPAVLLSGNHQEIAAWRNKQALRTTRKNRPDLLKNILVTESSHPTMKK